MLITIKYGSIYSFTYDVTITTTSTTTTITTTAINEISGKNYMHIRSFYLALQFMQ